MFKLEKIDALKECMVLAVETHRAIRDQLERDADDTLWRLDYVAMRASGRVAFGCGSGDRKLRRTGTGQALSFLYEYGQLLELTGTRQLVDTATRDRLQSLCQRAMFYTRRLWEDTLRPTDPPQPA